MNPNVDVSALVVDITQADAAGGGGGAGGITGAGTPGYIPMFTGAAILGNSVGWQTAGRIYWPDLVSTQIETEYLRGAAGVRFTVPVVDGAAGSRLATDGNGVLFWDEPEVFSGIVDVGGDLSGHTNDAVVVGLRGNALPVPGLSAGLLFWDINALSWLDPTALAIAGDVTGTLSAASVDAIRGYLLPVVPPADGDSIRFNAASGQFVWSQLASTTVVLMNGDVTGLSDSTFLSHLQGADIFITPAELAAGDLLMYDVIEGAEGWFRRSFAEVLTENPFNGDVSNVGRTVTVTAVQSQPFQAPTAPDDGFLVVFRVASGFVLEDPADQVFQLAGEVYGATNATVLGKVLGTTLSASAGSGVPELLLGYYSVGITHEWRAWDCQTAFLTTGEVRGSLTGWTVYQLFGQDLVLPSTPVLGDVLTFTAGGWAPAQPEEPTWEISGDVTGPNDSVTVVKLQGRPVSSAPPNVGDVVYWNGTQFAYQPVAAGGGGAPVLLTTTGGSPTITGTVNGANKVFTTSESAGDVWLCLVDGSPDPGATWVTTTLTTTAAPGTRIDLYSWSS